MSSPAKTNTPHAQDGPHTQDARENALMVRSTVLRNVLRGVVLRRPRARGGAGGARGGSGGGLGDGEGLLDADLHVLRLLFPSSLSKALEIIDDDAVSLVRAEISGRTIYTVSGSASAPYTCTPNICSCPAFNTSVLLRHDDIMCKHQLAAVIAHALGRVQVQTVTENEYISLLLSEPRSSVAHRQWTPRRSDHGGGYGHGVTKTLKF